MFKKKLLVSALALNMAVSPIYAADKKVVKAEPKGPSLYVQCDGNPNNMSAGESAARLLGAITLLALFAPAPEAADASKRKMGKDGVDACNQILLNDKGEGNNARRIELVLARALHQIAGRCGIGPQGSSNRRLSRRSLLPPIDIAGHGPDRSSGPDA
jgi:hypothetical protein